ncbi:MAG: transglycosylase SLT domain-containing protein [Pseudomonadales bacterium]|nr:lytic transglycosylase domain-containing protein [Pseudomonadales bacterium]NIX06509.1 transglycosylase SLT domain-containing protein [Pseudomonadales bacterium]
MSRSASLLIGLLLWAPGHAVIQYPYLSCFEAASRLHGVPLDLLLAVAATESNWDPDARSAANAHGIMQIQWPGTARHLGVSRLSELYNPCLNIERGAKYLSELLARSGGAEDRALAAYNYGPSRIAASSTLPPGALRYVSTVQGHRDRIASKADERSAAASLVAGETMRFDTALRARRYARSLDQRIDGANFVTRAEPEGGFAVVMRIASGGLSLADLNALERLGWPVGGD